MSVLQTTGLSKHFGGLKALNKVDLKVNNGEIFGIIGPNGAGKTTFLNLVTGFLKPSEGSIVYQKESIGGLKAHLIAQKGVLRTFQLTSLFGDLSVMDNMLIAHHTRTKRWGLSSLLKTRAFRREENEIRQRSMELLTFVGLEAKSSLVSKTLPFGDQRNLEVAIALASTPGLLLLDEPATGMNPTETRKLGALIQAVRERGTTIILVEHNMNMVMSICDRLAVLSFGAKIAEGAPAEVTKNKDVASIYLGETSAQS